jgi:hypothetical protein
LGDATNSNPDLMKYGLLYPYVGNWQIYKCPADVKLDKWGVPTCRSYSVNGWMGVTSAQAWKANQITFTNMASISAVLPPAMALTFMEENPITINDGSWIMDVPQDEAGGVPYWVDSPGHNHLNSGGLAFADGHCQTRQWTDTAILSDTGPGVGGWFPADPNSADLRWLAARATKAR